MFRLSLPILSGMKFRIGSKLAVTVGAGVVLVAAMVANQHSNNALVAHQAEMERLEQSASADLLRASIALQRMQIGTREIRLAISEREADNALAELEPREREIVALKFFAGLSNAELAKVLGVSESNAGTLLHRTMTKLRKACHATS